MSPLQGYLCHQQRTLPQNMAVFSKCTHWLLGNDGWAQILPAGIKKFWYPGKILLWVDSWSLCDFIFCFCPNGTIPIVFFNVPGSVHDSQVVKMGQIYRKLEKAHKRTVGQCYVDSAFANIDWQYLYKSCQDLLGLSAPTQAERKIKLRKKEKQHQQGKWLSGYVDNTIILPQETWSVHLQRAWRQRFVLKMFVLLYNLQARMVGVNQIRNTYMSHLQRNANEDVMF